MESIASANDEAKRNPSSSPDHQHAGGDDLISGLDNDVLVRILGLVADARDVVCTGVLSRRWGDLWTRAPVLAFDARPEFNSTGDVERYVAFVNNVLAKRAQRDDGIEVLQIPLLVDADCLRGQRDQLVVPSAEAAEGWIRYAAQHGVKCFVLKLRLPPKEGHSLSDIMAKLDELNKRFAEIIAITNDDGEEEEVNDEEGVYNDYDEKEDQEEELNDEEGVGSDEEEGKEYEVNDEDGVGDNDDDDAEEDELDESSSEEGDDHETTMIDLDDLPSSANLEAMRLDLDNVKVRLPSSTIRFPSLTHLCLEFIKLEGGSGDLLSRILSSACCPRLHKLRMLCIDMKPSGTRQLLIDVETLSELSLESMEGMEALELRTPNLLDLKIDDCQKLKSLTVSAPGLEELAFLNNRTRPDVHGDLPCVWALKVNLVSHMFSDCNINDTSICLLQRCSSARGLLVQICIPSLIERRVDMIKNKIPQFPHVTSLAVHMHPTTERHSFGDGVAGLLTRFNNLRYLGLQLDEVYGSKKKDEFWSEEDSTSFACDHEDHWESSDMSFVDLQKAEFRGLTGTDCELRFLQSVLASATDIRKVTVSFNVNYSLEGRMDQFQHKLLAHGTWTACNDDYEKSYKWRPSPEVESGFA